MMTLGSDHVHASGDSVAAGTEPFTEVETLRAGLTPLDRALLDHALGFGHDIGDAVPGQVLFHGQELAPARAAVSRLVAMKALTANRDHSDSHSVTVLGAIIGPRHARVEKLLTQYIAWLQAGYLAKPSVPPLIRADARDLLGIAEADLDELHRLVMLSGLHGGGQWSSSDWRIDPPANLHVLALEPDPRRLLYRLGLSGLPSSSREFAALVAGEVPAHLDCARNRLDAVSDPALRQMLEDDLAGAEAAYAGERWLVCMFHSGRAVEALLLHALEQRQGGEYAGELRSLTLGKLAEAAVERHLLPDDLRHLTQALREFRNLSHPGKQLRERAIPNGDRAAVCLSAMRLMVDHILPIHTH